MTALDGQILIDGALISGRVLVEGDRIAAVEFDPSVTGEQVVAPGYIDLQVNGAFGVDFGEKPERIAEVAARLPATGVTAFLPTIVSSFADRYRRVFEAMPGAMAASGARILGLHLEGPFLAPAKQGAHALDAIEAADEALFDELLAEPSVRLVTLAPECDPGFRVTRMLADQRILVAAGHSDASLDQLRGAIDAGLRLDLLVAETVIVELKAVHEHHPVFEAQLLTYLKLTKCRLGLLINFNVPLIKEGIRRIIL